MSAAARATPSRRRPTADVRGLDARRVVDAVAHEPHHLAGVAQRIDDPHLLVG